MKTTQSHLKTCRPRSDPYRRSNTLIKPPTEDLKQSKLTTIQIKKRPYLKCTILVLVLNFKFSVACRGSGSGSYYWHHSEPKTPHPALVYPDEVTPKRNISKVKNHLNRNVLSAWGGWTPPPDVREDWAKWLHDWELKNNDTDFMDLSKKDKYKNARGIGSGWPVSWADLGDGIGGAPPPHWAYAPRYNGKPAACSQPPHKGHCKANQTRWGFNPFSETCMNFTWSGCGGNYNNFLTKLKCEELCLAPAPSGCDNDSHIYIDEFNNIISQPNPERQV